ncbi:MAG TPA: alpha/beta hydrolase, partial [Steroidobacteraceae bacterium]|nr:alpha/beta hydrolase [Steroidobacteraceae bacterium]
MKTLFAAALALASSWTLPAGAAPTVHYHTSNIDGVNVFYREAGPADAPAIVLLHGFPTSSNMFRNLIPALADRYHVIAPDYPGFGQSEMPERTKFQYSFAHFADITDTLLTRLAVPRYALYVMDYGAPVGYRLALKHPERVTALVIQNGNAYEEGLGDFWKPIKAYWASGQPAQREVLRAGTTLEATRSQYVDG